LAFVALCVVALFDVAHHLLFRSCSPLIALLRTRNVCSPSPT
jgi:hypothetical protein